MLPKLGRPNGVNTVEKYCSYCKKAEHKRDECWSLNGRPGKERASHAKASVNKKVHVNTAVKSRKKKVKIETTASSSSEDEDKPKKNKMRAVKEYQVMGQTYIPNGLDLITLSIEEDKKGRMSFFLDSGATLLALKGDTPMKKERTALTGVTGHQMYTLGKIKATVMLGNKRIRHTMYVVKDDFPIDYEGILGIDFLKQQRAKCDHGKKQVRIGNAIL